MRVLLDGESRDFGSPQAHSFLAILLLQPGRTGTLAELVHGIWGDRPPDTAVATVRTHAWKWRRFFASCGVTRDVLQSYGDGYRLVLPKPLTDVDEVEALTALAAKAKKDGLYADADALFQKALGHWSGNPLALVPGGFAELQRARLAEMYNVLVEERCEVRIALGEAAFVVPDLTALTAANPLRQRAHRLLMEALHETGRQAEAIAVFGRLRKTLSQVHGIDPEPGLITLHQRILTGEAGPKSPEQAPPARRTPATVWPVPHQLPHDIRDFTGNEHVLETLTDALLRPASTAPTVVAVDGLPGSGKSTLAIRAAHQVQHAFPAGVLYADLSAGRDAADPAVALTGFLLSLGISRSDLPDRLCDLAALFRSMIDGHRLLIVLDHAHDAEQILPLLPGSPRCVALVTSTLRLQSPPVTQRISLRPVSSQKALDLLASVLGKERLLAELPAAEALAQACGRLPLVLRAVGDWLASRPHWSLRNVLDQVSPSSGFRFEHWRSVVASFDRGVRLLEPAQADAWTRLAWMAGEINAASVATLLSLPRERAEMLLEELVDVSLLEPAAGNSYRIPDLLRQFARRKGLRHREGARAFDTRNWTGRRTPPDGPGAGALDLGPRAAHIGRIFRR